MITNSSASRLLYILKQAKSIPAQTQSKSAWNKILKIENNNSLLFKRLGNIMMLPEQIENDINSIKDIENKELYLNWKTSVNNAFISQNLSGQWGSFINHIDDHTLNYLELTANTLKDKKLEAHLSEKQLEEIKNDFLEIQDEISNSKIDSQLKKFILKKIIDIISAVDEYNIQGISPLEDAINITIGQIVINNELRQASKKSNISEKFWKLLGNVAIILTLATSPQNIKEISHQIKNILLLNTDIKIEDSIDAEIIENNKYEINKDISV